MMKRDIMVRTDKSRQSPMVAPADQRTVRRHNLGLVLGNIAKGGRRSRARVSTETGLNPSTVSSLVGDLIEWGLIVEVGVEQDGSIGRPGRSLELNPDGGAALGVEIADDGVGVLALDLVGTVRYRAFISQDNREKVPAEVVAQAADLTAEALKAFRNAKIAKVCTIAVPGLVARGDVLLQAPNIGWNNVPVLSIWRERLPDVPLRIDNEARLASYAEMTMGIARNIGSFAYVSGGIGIGSGLVLDRKIYRGSHGFAGELGHTIIDRSVPPRSWGAQGSLQTLAGELALLELAGLPTDGRLARSDPDWTGREVARRASAGDARALAALDTVGAALGVGISNLYNLLDMEAVVLGGYFTHVAEWLKGPIERELNARVNAEHWAELSLRFSGMGREAAVRGAAAWSLDAILERAGQEGAEA
ncbi:ROK family transcriptional regulator [Devosia sp. 66-22]|uniref:ROK family transcriptional regulator n=1 Tax=Devosia sp. 66-22 TaxID=1895753 RepID=UPI0026149AC5|nr:ROK family transcriptional regulator [Devosia sp. 66-22]